MGRPALDGRRPRRSSRARFVGKTSPVHLFWHGLDLARDALLGPSRPPIEGADPVTAEAYSHEVVSFGFWAGDDRVPAPAFYSYTAPEPADLTEQPLAPPAAAWQTGPDRIVGAADVRGPRADPDPRAALLEFLESAYVAGRDDRGLGHGGPGPPVGSAVPEPATVGLITGTGLYELDGLEERPSSRSRRRTAPPRWSRAASRGFACSTSPPRARPRPPVAPGDAQATSPPWPASAPAALVSTTVCGAVDPSLELGSLVVFDDLHFPSNRLADGSLCTLFTSPEIEGRGHWIYDRPFGAGRAVRAGGRRPGRRAWRCATAASTATSTGRGSTRSARSPSSPRPA